jgi:hypothetical protein
LQHLVLHGSDLATPELLYPVFHGSYDWHSSVHMHATLARLLRSFPARPWEAAVLAHFEARLTTEHVAAERAYMAPRERRTFERPYGWAWLLRLQKELDLLGLERRELTHWADTLRPLSQDIVQRWLTFMPQQEWPVRAGVHANSAFAFVLGLEYAEHADQLQLSEAIRERSRLWYAADACYPAEYEPSGEDFLSGGLCEALLMSQVLGSDFAAFWQRFSPQSSALARWLTPVTVRDPSDARLLHLHGLNLSRAWCWRGILPSLPAALAEPVQAAIQAHIAASIDAASEGDYGATHWLASFVILALEQQGV